jgi:2-dehydropantoate 2-reductase
VERGVREQARPRTDVAVLGLGGVGGAIAARTSAVCVGTPETAAAVRERGLTLEHDGVVTEAHPVVVERLDRPVGLLVVAVKAPSLPAALERIEVFAVADGVVLSLLNGLEHPDVLRRRLGPRVAPGSISRFQAHAPERGRVVQLTGVPLITAASNDLEADVLSQALEPLRAAGFDVVVADDERAVLWEKAARLAPLAAATAASGLDLGGLRSHGDWWERLTASIAEACAVATADGVSIPVDEQLAIVAAMPGSLTTSTARDVAAGRASELDAIVGSVLRAAHRLRVAAPVLGELLREAEAA